MTQVLKFHIHHEIESYVLMGLWLRFNSSAVRPLTPTKLSLESHYKIDLDVFYYPLQGNSGKIQQHWCLQWQNA